ncbi:MAG: RIP metalloprotease RseP [Thermomicrobiales bacterium]
MLTGLIDIPQGLITGLYIVPVLAVLILVHEIGHFVAARLIGVRVEEFGIGIPPRIKGWRYKGVLWSFNWIPFGGFVKVHGEDAGATDSDSINAKSPWQRGFFLIAGSLMNFLLAIVLMVAIVGFQGTASFNFYVDDVQPDSPAAAANWQRGDRIVEVAGVPITTSAEVGRQARDFAGRPMSVVFERGDKLIESTVEPRANPPANQGPVGISISGFQSAAVTVGSVSTPSPAATAGLQAGDRILNIGSIPVRDGFSAQFGLESAQGQNVPVILDRSGETVTAKLAVPTLDPEGDSLAQVGIDARLIPEYTKVPLIEVIPVGVGQALDQAGAMVGSIKDLVTGKAALNQIAGPVGMGQITSEIVAESPLPLWVTLSQLAILLSLNLAVLNLLPIPALDGGRLLFVIIEILRGGKKLAPEREGLVHFAGLILLLGLMVIITFFDFGRILQGHSFLP